MIVALDVVAVQLHVLLNALKKEISTLSMLTHVSIVELAKMVAQWQQLKKNS
jgi:hypothetical protein